MPKDSRAGSSDPRQSLAAALDKIVIRSPVEFSYAGEPATDARSAQNAPIWGAPAAQSDDLLVRAIHTTFYDRCYALRDGAPRSAAPDPEFARRLAAANSGREHWDRGWVVHQFGPNGQAFVRKGDRERLALPGAFIFDGAPGAALQIGASLSLRAPRDTFEAQPGYYFVFGETLDELADQMSLSRFYFHVRAEAAALLLGELSTALNRFQTPFQFKTPSAASLYGRADAAVLYVGQRYAPIVTRIIERIRDKITLEPATPLFTKTLWPGIGAAVEPGSGESFGLHRSRLAAEGIVDAWRQGDQSAATRLAAIEARFAQAGLDLTRPWIGANGVDPFERPSAARLP